MGAVTLADVRADRSRFPADRLAGCETALILFGAAFTGRNDAIWIRDAGITATVVDLDRERLDEMELIYPESWTFVEADAFAFVKGARDRWDLVTVDPWSDGFTTAADNLAAWCACANVRVLLGTGAETVLPALPDGWQVVDRQHRSDHAGGVYWTILERA